MPRLLDSWKRKSKGSTAIEFALLSFPFIMMILGLLEVSLMFVSASMLEGGTSAASRLIRTCQLQNMAGDPQENFVQAFCSHAVILTECEANLQVEAIPVPDGSFSGASAFTANFDSNGNFMPSGFDPGAMNDVVLIRAVYNYQHFVPLFSMLTGGADSTTPFMSTTVLQIEPCEFEE
jgi:Flp pilus assembly protein TadG